MKRSSYDIERSCVTTSFPGKYVPVKETLYNTHICKLLYDLLDGDIGRFVQREKVQGKLGGSLWFVLNAAMIRKLSVRVVAGGVITK